MSIKNIYFFVSCVSQNLKYSLLLALLSERMLLNMAEVVLPDCSHTTHRRHIDARGPDTAWVHTCLPSSVHFHRA